MGYFFLGQTTWTRTPPQGERARRRRSSALKVQDHGRSCVPRDCVLPPFWAGSGCDSRGARAARLTSRHRGPAPAGRPVPAAAGQDLSCTQRPIVGDVTIGADSSIWFGAGRAR